MFDSIIENAFTAAHKAATTCQPDPMSVRGSNSESYFVADGICGNATIRFKANTKFAKWAIKNGVASKSSNGAKIRNNLCSQSYMRNKAFADAFVLILAENGIDAYADAYID